MHKIQIVNKSNFQLPEYKTKDSAGVDLHANLNGESFTLKPLVGMIPANPAVHTLMGMDNNAMATNPTGTVTR